MTIKNIFWFCILEFLFWCLLSLVYFFVSGFYPSFLGALFTALFIPGNTLMFAAGLCVLLLVLRLIGPRTAYWGAVLLGSLFNIVLLLDIFVYTQYRFHLSMSMLQLFFGPAGREIFVFPLSMYLLTAGAVLAIIGFSWAMAGLARKIPWGGKAAAAAGGILLLIFAGYNAMYAWGKFMAVPAVLTQVTYLPWAQPLSMNRRLRKMGFEPASQPYQTPKAGTLNYPLAPMACSPEEKPNILLVLIDSWRADSFTPEIMPHLYGAYKESPDAFYFTSHLAGGNATEAGVFSLMYSMPYSYWDAVTGAKVRPVLMDVLAKQGYEFGIYASSRLNSPEFNQNVFSHIPDLRISSDGEAKWERDEDAQKDFLAFLDQRDNGKPFFGFLFYDSAHGQEFPPDYDAPFTPYGEQMNYLLLTKNTDPTPYMNRYKNSVHYIDGLIGDLFDDLKKRGLDKNTIILVTGDHGQEVNDTRNNFWGHNSNFAKYQTHVPLLIWWPQLKGGEKDYRTSHYDLVPALLTHALKCSNPAQDYSSGTDLFDPAPRPWTLILSYTNKAVREGDKISVLNNYGGMTNYDENFVPSDTPVSASALAESLKEFSHFYK